MRSYFTEGRKGEGCWDFPSWVAGPLPQVCHYIPTPGLWLKDIKPRPSFLSSHKQIRPGPSVVTSSPTR